MQKLINRFSHYISVKQQLDSEKEAVIAYGMLALAQMLIILLLAVIVGLITNAMAEALLVYLIVGGLRKFTGGIHANSMVGCICVSIVTLTLMVTASKYLLAPALNPYFMLGIVVLSYSLIFLVVYKRVPVDSPNKPITNQQKIERLRKHSFLFVFMLLLISVVFLVASFRYTDIRLYSINCSIILALLWQTFTLTNLAKVLFKKLRRDA